MFHPPDRAPHSPLETAASPRVTYETTWRPRVRPRGRRSYRGHHGASSRGGSPRMGIQRVEGLVGSWDPSHFDRRPPEPSSNAIASGDASHGWERTSLRRTGMQTTTPTQIAHGIVPHGDGQSHGCVALLYGRKTRSQTPSVDAASSQFEHGRTRKKRVKGSPTSGQRGGRERRVGKKFVGIISNFM